MRTAVLLSSSFPALSREGGVPLSVCSCLLQCGAWSMGLPLPVQHLLSVTKLCFVSTVPYFPLVTK